MLFEGDMKAVESGPHHVTLTLITPPTGRMRVVSTEILPLTKFRKAALSTLYTQQQHLSRILCRKALSLCLTETVYRGSNSLLSSSPKYGQLAKVCARSY